MQKSSTKYYKFEFNNVYKGSYMIKWHSFQRCKDGSLFTNKCDTTFKKEMIKTTVIATDA